jgi:hypothetical protein
VELPNEDVTDKGRKVIVVQHLEKRPTREEIVALRSVVEHCQIFEARGKMMVGPQRNAAIHGREQVVYVEGVESNSKI